MSQVNLKIFVLYFFFIFTTVSPRFFKNLYHTNDEIYSILDNLSNGTCTEILQSKEYKEPKSGKTMKYYLISSKAKNPNQNKVALFFGEHGNEVISPELAISIITNLCDSQINNKESFYSKKTLNTLLNQNEFLFIPIINEYARTLVEKGNFCQRTNENSVDLNRNWGNHWTYNNKIKDEYSGEYPFSEWQTRVMRDILKFFNPNIFITTHSGGYFLFMPLTYKKIPLNELDESLRKSYDILSHLSQKYCHCDYGSIADKLFYEAHGSLLDFAYEDLGIKYAFAFEIYNGEGKNQFYNKLFDKNTHISPFDITKFDKKSFIQLNNKLKKIKTIENRNSSCFLEFKEKVDDQFKYCIYFKNPLEQDKFTKTVLHWTNAYFELFSIIYKKENKSK